MTNAIDGVTPLNTDESIAVLPAAIQGDQDVIKQAKIMIVDDEPFNITVTRRYLEKVGYRRFVTASDSQEAFELIQNEAPDALLLDIMMPHVSGLEILEQVRGAEQLQLTPVIMITAASDAETKQRALELGATDFLNKPVDPNDLIPRVRNALLVKSHHDHLAGHAEELERQVRLRTAELAESREQVVHCLARAGEYRDDDTGHHVMRVGKYAGIIARELGFSESRTEMLEMAAQLHDVGKIGIPDSILLSTDKLDPQQYNFMQQHCAVGKQIIQPLADEDWKVLRRHTGLGAGIMNVNTSPLLVLASRIAQTHHEKWDGTGYPLGLAAEDIPVEGRIAAVADVYDALSSKRPYKPAFPREKCFGILKEERGKHFDPDVIDAFFARSDDIIRIQLDYMDNSSVT